MRHHPLGAAIQKRRDTLVEWCHLLLFAGAQPTLTLPNLPDQAAVDRDLAVYEAFVGR
jgi:hypothetical protein